MENGEYLASQEDMVERSKQHPRAIFMSDNGTVIQNGQVYTKEEWELMVGMMKNPRTFKLLIRIMNFFRLITFRKPFK